MNKNLCRTLQEKTDQTLQASVSWQICLTWNLLYCIKGTYVYFIVKYYVLCNILKWPWLKAITFHKWLTGGQLDLEQWFLIIQIKEKRGGKDPRQTSTIQVRSRKEWSCLSCLYIWVVICQITHRSQAQWRPRAEVYNTNSSPKWTSCSMAHSFFREKRKEFYIVQQKVH